MQCCTKGPYRAAPLFWPSKGSFWPLSTFQTWNRLEQDKAKCPRGGTYRISSDNFRTFEWLPHTAFAQRKCGQCLTTRHKNQQWPHELRQREL